MKSIGIIGNTGRMGIELTREIEQNENFSVGTGFNSMSSELISIVEVFKSNDYIIDFSNANLLEKILKAAAICPKPIIICTTDWSQEELQHYIDDISSKVPVVISPNTSLGVYVLRHLVKILAEMLGTNYDIDVTERHHRHKKDIPSGTAKSLLNDILKKKKLVHNLSYRNFHLKEGPRPQNYIDMMAYRSGNVFGEHEVSFTSKEDMISVKHIAYSRKLFASGALNIVSWLDDKNIDSGIYSMDDIFRS
jgi:4-hydroxy-tetrahydrodipicolinate reductase